LHQALEGNVPAARYIFERVPKSRFKGDRYATIAKVKRSLDQNTHVNALKGLAPVRIYKRVRLASALQRSGSGEDWRA
jgi:hypothetical protein